MALLMQWLSESEDVGFETGQFTIYNLLNRWMKLVLGTGEPRLDLDWNQRWIRM